MKFKDKVVIVTGASSGIGAATARRFADEGANVVISYKTNMAGAEEVASDINKIGGEALMVQADLCEEKDAERLVAAAFEKFGQIDILINNAGRYIDGDEWNGSSDIWTESLKQNLVSTMSVSKYVIEIFQKQKSGVIVSVASRFGISGAHDSLSYSAAKAGIINITQSYSKLMAPWGRANCVSPGPVDSGYWLNCPKAEREEMIAAMPNKKLIEVSEVVDAVIKLASDESANITGQNVAVDGK